MGIWEQEYNIEQMKNTVVEIFGLEAKITIDFFFKCDIMSYERLENYFYRITERYGVAA